MNIMINAIALMVQMAIVFALISVHLEKGAVKLCCNCLSRHSPARHCAEIKESISGAMIRLYTANERISEMATF